MANENDYFLISKIRGLVDYQKASSEVERRLEVIRDLKYAKENIESSTVRLYYKSESGNEHYVVPDIDYEIKDKMFDKALEKARNDLKRQQDIIFSYLELEKNNGN